MSEEAGDTQIGTPHPWIGRIGNILLAGYLVIIVSSFFLLPTLRAGWVRLTSSGSSSETTQVLSSLVQHRVEVLTYFVVPFLVGVVYLACGLYVYLVRRTYPSGRVFSVFALASAFTLAGFFAVSTSTRFTLLWLLSIMLAAGALLNLALIFPRESSWILKHRYLSWIGYIPGAVVCLFLVLSIANPGPSPAFVYLMGLALIYLFLATLCFTVMEGVRSYRSASPVVREQARLIFIGALISFIPIYTWLLLNRIMPGTTFSPLLFLPLCVLPVTTGFAILRYHFLNSNYLVSKLVLYGLLTVIVAGAYALIVSGIGLLLGDFLRPYRPFIAGIIIFLLALILNPLRTRLQKVVDSVFFRGQAIYRSRLEAFSKDLTQAIDLAVIVRLLRQYSSQDLHPDLTHIYVYESFNGQYSAQLDENGQITSDLRFTDKSDLVKELAQRRDAIFLEDVNSLPASIQSERSRLVLLDCQIFIPLPGRQHLIGWLALGERESGEPYTERDLDFLISLCDQAAVAIERAQVIRDLQRRVKEMDVLTRVAQGTNFTINFDDILELIYAQTSQVIKVDDFHVALLDSESEKMHYVFFLEKDERIPEFEGKEIILGQGLEAEIFRGRRPLLVDDYEQECWARGFVPDVRGLHAWMAVPLNTGGETIGLISLGSRGTDTVYQPEQLNLFQAMADQAAGAIVKARLLHVTEDRARQLATLNEIGRDLTSTLDLKPLLNRILTSAANILNCQAGSLFLVDQQTGELVFEVVIGPVAGDLIGKRLPSGKGVVGQAVDTGQPVIANDARRRKEWFNTDQQTGFTTQDLLAVPMRIKDHILGVIEVINKADGQPFNISDQELLATFASQAAIAIENARLYTMTDHALTVKVEELSVMQRIDRELNTSLDVNRAMNITLSWAMRQSGANAGLVGMIDSDGIRVVTAEGYTSDAESDILPSNGNDDHYLDVQLPGISGALQTGQPTTVYKEAANGSFASLLMDAKGQVGIPIRREDEVIGILLLETQSTENFSDDVLAFLSRLGDHAAIAIANAQLYSEVREANLSKSKFVSFVAHELKNPMASIKGYTELIAGGMTGPVNEMQSSFLNTIRSNVDRMNTIVSDLNDLTKIQVGSLRLEFKSISVPEAVDEVERTLLKLLDEKRQTLSVELPPELPRIWADPLRLSQILTNLVSNANKYTGEDGNILLSAEAWMPGEAAESNLRFVHIWVKDNGIGISEEDQDKIFQQYFRTDISKETASGTGLGLNISKSLVEFQGGRIWFESKRNEGSTFHITIPAAESN